MAKPRSESKVSTGIDRNIGERLRALRQAKGLSQGKLGDVIGIKYQQVQKYESGKDRVSASNLWEFSNFLGVEVSHFYDGLARPAAASTPGFAEGAAQPYEPPPAAGEANQLIEAFRRIERPQVRRHLLALAKSLADAPPKPPRSGRPSRPRKS